MPNKNILNHKIPIAHNYSGFTQMWIMMTVWCLGLNSYSLPSHCFTWLGWKDVGRNLKETCYCLLDFWVYPLKNVILSWLYTGELAIVEISSLCMQVSALAIK